MESVGAVIVGIVTVQLLVLLCGQIQQTRRSGQQRRLSFDLLQQRIDAANALRVRREQTQLLWNGNRKFVVQHKVEEAETICSFYLVPHDGKQLPQFRPGQYLTFRVNVPGQAKPVTRCYSLSDGPDPKYYRITVKRVPPPRNNPDTPPGLISNHFLDNVKEGDILDVQAPRGHFALDPDQTRPVVLIGGGVGITPVLSMLAAIVNCKAERDVWLFYGVRNRHDHALQEQIDELDEQHDRTRIVVCYSQPLAEDTRGPDYEFDERISVSLMKRVLDSNNYDFYICGPPPMMSSVLADLKEWGVPANRVFSEAFGPASGKAVGASKKEKPAAKKGGKAVAGPKVTFERSGVSVNWDDSFENLLDCALGNNVSIDSGCRAGSCGSCLVAIKSGKVANAAGEETEHEEGTCLACVSVPDGELVLDA